MHNIPVNVLLQFISGKMFLKFEREQCCHKIILGVMGLKITTLSQEPVIQLPIHDNGKLYLT